MNNLNIAQLAVASPKWKWMPGMSVCRWSDQDVRWRMNRVSVLAERGTFWLWEGWLPDLTDSATLGCILALVREAWDDPYLCCVGDRDTGWRLDGHASVEDLHSYPSEAEALVGALVAAPSGLSENRLP